MLVNFHRSEKFEARYFYNWFVEFEIIEPMVINFLFLFFFEALLIKTRKKLQRATYVWKLQHDFARTVVYKQIPNWISV